MGASPGAHSASSEKKYRRWRAGDEASEGERGERRWRRRRRLILVRIYLQREWRTEQSRAEENRTRRGVEIRLPARPPPIL